MLTRSQVCVELKIERKVLEGWVAEGWLLPALENGEEGYTEIDIARGRLIMELREELGVNDEGTGVILDLLDQIHGLRQALALLHSRQRMANGRRRTLPPRRLVQR